MANKAISGLTALTTVADGDLIPIVDVSDATQAASGTTKYVTSKQGLYSPATKVVAPSSSGVRADYYATGTADDVPINAAIVAAAGGTVIIRKGTYNLTNLVNINVAGTILRGEGILSVLYKSSSFNNNLVNLAANDTVIRDIKLDGNSSNITTDNHGINIGAFARCKVIACHITNIVHHGIQAPSATDVVIRDCYVSNTGKVASPNADGVGIIVGSAANNCKISNCTVTNTGFHGIQVYHGTQKVFINNCHVTTVGQTANTGNGLEIHQNTGDIHVSNCYFATGSTNGQGINMSADVTNGNTSGVNITNCTVELFNNIGIRIDGVDHVNIYGCNIRNNGQTGSSSLDFGIRINDGTSQTSSRVNIVGNNIYDDQGVATQGRPIGIYNSSDKVLIIGNNLHGHVTSDSIYTDVSSSGTITKANNFEG